MLGKSAHVKRGRRMRGAVVRRHGGAHLCGQRAPARRGRPRARRDERPRVGALGITHGGRPNVVDLVAAMEAGPFTLTYHGGMMSCRLLNFACQEPEGRDWELVVVFEAA